MKDCICRQYAWHPDCPIHGTNKESQEFQNWESEGGRSAEDSYAHPEETPTEKDTE